MVRRNEVSLQVRHQIPLVFLVSLTHSLDPAEERVHLASPDLRNALVLVDESSGEVVGHLAENVRIREDPSVLAPGNEKAPVVVDLPSSFDHASTSTSTSPLSTAQGGGKGGVGGERGGEREGGWEEEVNVRTIPYDGDDFLMRSAHLLRYVPSFLSTHRLV